MGISCIVIFTIFVLLTENSAPVKNVETATPKSRLPKTPLIKRKISKVLCPKNECKSLQNGRPLYRDADHMSENGNKILTPMFKDALNP